MNREKLRQDALVLLLTGVTLAGCAGTGLRLPPAEERSPGYQQGFRLGHADAEFVAPARPTGTLFKAGEVVRLTLPVGRYFEKLPPDTQARLTLRLWHADPSSRPQGPSRQTHRLRLNGQELPESVGGISGAWSIFSAEVPVSWLRLPEQPRAGGQPEPAENTLELLVQAAGGDGQGGVIVDWARIELDGPRPWVLSHGFLADRTSWRYWQTWAKEAGVPTWAFDFAESNGSMWDHAVELGEQVAAAKRYFGVDSVNLVASSKGGVDGRAYLAMQGSDVERALWVAGPHGGSELADIVKLAEGLPGGSFISRIGEPALTGATVQKAQVVAGWARRKGAPGQ